jgi:peptide/nickel transport system permease protein
MTVEMSAPTGLVASIPVPPIRRVRPTLPMNLTIGAAILVLWSLATAIVPVVLQRSAEDVVYGTKLLPPSLAYPFGTDGLGRDVLIRTIVAFRYDMMTGLISVSAAATLGILIGALAGSAAEWLDNLVMRALDVISAFPSFILALTLAAALHPSMATVILSIAIVMIPLYARGSRAAILAERAKPYAEAARAMAIPPVRIVLVHLLPNSLGPTLTQVTMDVANAIMIAAGLSFIGFGIQPPTPEWGLMINEGSSYIVDGQWWVSCFPGLAILSIVVAFFLLDDGLKRWRGG